MSEPREYHELELLTEIIGFIPKKLLDELYDHMNIVIYNVVEGINERLEETHKDKAIIIFDKFKLYEKELETTLDKVFNRFEQYMYAHVWKLPDHLDIHAHNDTINIKINEETEDALNEYVNALKVKTRAQRLLNMRLKREIQSVEYQTRSYDTYRKLAHSLKEAMKKKQLIDFGETMTFIKDRIDELKDILDEVLATVDELETKKDVDPKAALCRKNIKNVLEKLSKNIDNKMN